MIDEVRNDHVIAVTENVLCRQGEQEWREVVQGVRREAMSEVNTGGEVSENRYEGLSGDGSSDESSDENSDGYSDDSTDDCSDEMMNVIERMRVASKTEKRRKESLREKARHEKRRLVEEKEKKEREGQRDLLLLGRRAGKRSQS